MGFEQLLGEIVCCQLENTHIFLWTLELEFDDVKPGLPDRPLAEPSIYLLADRDSSGFTPEFVSVRCHLTAVKIEKGYLLLWRYFDLSAVPPHYPA